MDFKLQECDGEQTGALKEFKDLPVEVIEGHILPLLKWNELLRVRRVSTGFNRIVNKYINIHPQLAPEIEINETDKTLKEFIKLNTPTTKFYFNNSKTGYNFFADPCIPEFLKLHAGQITHVRMAVTTYFGMKKEREFLSELTKLESVECISFELIRFVRCEEINDLFTQAMSISGMPNTVLGLKSLKLCPPAEGHQLPLPHLMGMLSEFLADCNQLEYAMFPFVTHCLFLTNSFPTQFADHDLYALDAALTIIKNAVTDKPNLRIFDFQHYYISEMHDQLPMMEGIALPKLIELCQQSLIHDVKLKNVVSSWFLQLNPVNVNPAIGQPIVSLVNLDPAVLFLDLKNLEELNIKATTRCALNASCQLNRPSWPSLRKLTIVVDSGNLSMAMLRLERADPSFSERMTNAHFQFFFENITRPALTELKLKWKKGGKKVVPSVDDLIRACPNLNKLTIVNWPGTNKVLSELWSGLPTLTEICLDGCKKLGNVAFVGEDIDNPVFLKLQNLRRLSLMNLDQMPKLSDTLFKLVLKSMNLTQLTLSSGKPLEKVTSTGIRSLLSGNFASSIEKFPFKGWSLKDCSDVDFLKLQTEFRSYNMI